MERMLALDDVTDEAVDGSFEDRQLADADRARGMRAFKGRARLALTAVMALDEPMWRETPAGWRTPRPGEEPLDPVRVSAEGPLLVFEDACGRRMAAFAADPCALLRRAARAIGC
ncbi:hypothetical protein [Bifidobacterium myosotis]|uniref:Uncharacterized protein n=1 Tax=Bifidobacterium myosotis TaxID=1630166 RepID=A0A5M9ZH81_9BIFI|nr:hypothetical protein [Bifidobacterium myosotis]KAA8826936.1 hypothetical protein EMO91_10420 [Bifidobacterium myosotis]